MAIIKGGTNITGGSSGIKWNIKAIPDESQLPKIGKPGDIYVITNRNIKNLTKVANIYDGYDLVNNAINIFINDSLETKRINYFNDWYFDVKFNSQTILLDGNGLYCPVYFYNGYLNKFESVQVSYNNKDSFSIKSFAGYDLDLDSIYKEILYTEEFNYDKPHVDRYSYESEFDVYTFAGSDLNIDEILISPISYDEEIINR